MDLCLECFAGGVEIGEHKNNHDYHFSNNGYFSVFPESPKQNKEDQGMPRRKRSLRLESDEWTVREDTQLLNAVEEFGFGNWKEIAKDVEGKSHLQVG